MVELGFVPWAAGWEARMLPLCYAALLFAKFKAMVKIRICFFLATKKTQRVISKPGYRPINHRPLQVKSKEPAFKTNGHLSIDGSTLIATITLSK